MVRSGQLVLSKEQAKESYLNGCRGTNGDNRQMIKCVKYNPYAKGTLLGFADIFVPKWGVEIYGLTFHEKDGKRWVNFPSREYEKDGEKKHADYFRFPESGHYHLFCKQVKEAIEIKIQETQGEDTNESNSTFCF